MWVATEQKTKITYSTEHCVCNVIGTNIEHGTEKGQRKNESPNKGDEGGPPPNQEESKQNDQAVDHIGSLCRYKNLPSFAAIPRDKAVGKIALPEVLDELVVPDVQAGEATAKEMRGLMDRGMGQVPEDPNHEDR